MAELRTVGIIGLAVGGAVLVCLFIVLLLLILRFRYNKWKASHPSKDPRSHSKIFACYSCCCCIEEGSKKHKGKAGLDPQISVSYQSEGISLGEETQGVVIKNAERYKDSSFTNAAFAESHDTNNEENDSDVETRSAGIGKDMKIVISSSDDEDFEVRRNIPIRRSADAYSEIDLRESALNSQYLEVNRKTEANEKTKTTKLKKARKWKNTNK